MSDDDGQTITMAAAAELIRQARADERERLNAGMKGYAREVRREALTDMRDQVGTMLDEASQLSSSSYDQGIRQALRDVLILLDTDGEKPVDLYQTWRPA